MLFNPDCTWDGSLEIRRKIRCPDGSVKSSWKRWHLRRVWKDKGNLKSKSPEGQHPIHKRQVMVSWMIMA
jgi:hypothetical protein